MEWLYWVYGISIQSVFLYVVYIFGQRAGLLEMEARVQHITETLVEQHYEIVELKKLNTRSVHDIKTKIFGSIN